MSNRQWSRITTRPLVYPQSNLVQSRKELFKSSGQEGGPPEGGGSWWWNCPIKRSCNKKCPLTVRFWIKRKTKHYIPPCLHVFGLNFTDVFITVRRSCVKSSENALMPDGVMTSDISIKIHDRMVGRKCMLLTSRYWWHGFIKSHHGFELRIWILAFLEFLIIHNWVFLWQWCSAHWYVSCTDLLIDRGKPISVK